MRPDGVANGGGRGAVIRLCPQNYYTEDLTFMFVCLKTTSILLQRGVFSFNVFV